MVRGLRSVCSYAAKEESSSHYETASPTMQQAQQVPVAPIQPAPQVSDVPGYSLCQWHNLKLMWLLNFHPF